MKKLKIQGENSISSGKNSSFYWFYHKFLLFLDMTWVFLMILHFLILLENKSFSNRKSTPWNLRSSRVRQNQKLTLSQIGRILKPFVIGGPKQIARAILTLVSDVDLRALLRSSLHFFVFHGSFNKSQIFWWTV